jgi:hypothetical protein
VENSATLGLSHRLCRRISDLKARFGGFSLF